MSSGPLTLEGNRTQTSPRRATPVAFLTPAQAALNLEGLKGVERDLSLNLVKPSKVNFEGFQFDYRVAIPPVVSEKSPLIAKGPDNAAVKIYGMGDQITWGASFRSKYGSDYKAQREICKNVEYALKEINKFSDHLRFAPSEIRVVDFIGHIITPSGEKLEMRGAPFSISSANSEKVEIGLVITKQILKDKAELIKFLTDFKTRHNLCDGSGRVNADRTLKADRAWGGQMLTEGINGNYTQKFAGFTRISSATPFEWGIDVSRDIKRLAVVVTNPLDTSRDFEDRFFDSNLLRAYGKFWDEKLVPLLRIAGHDSMITMPIRHPIARHSIGLQARQVLRDQTEEILKRTFQFVSDNLPVTGGNSGEKLAAQYAQPTEGRNLVLLGEFCRSNISRGTTKESSLLTCAILKMLEEQGILPEGTQIFRKRNSIDGQGTHAFATVSIPEKGTYCLDTAHDHFGMMADQEMILRGRRWTPLLAEQRERRADEYNVWSYLSGAELATLGMQAL